MKNISSLYIHIPFCHNLCYFCDFNKVLAAGQPINDYVLALSKEIALIKKTLKLSKLKTIYLGGGTPSLLNTSQLSIIFQAIRSYFSISDGAEITIEANPEDLTRKKIKTWRDLGINRLSLGVQSFDEKLLKKIGRKHNVDDVEKAVYLAKSYGFKNISFDLIYSLPQQNLLSLINTLKKALSFDLPHYSFYSLIIEEHTLFNNYNQVHQLKLPSEDLSAKMMNLVIEQLENSGLIQYEISNFAKIGQESLHNLVYWNNEHYLGIGAGASGYYENIRYKNHGPINHYLEALSQDKLPIVAKEKLTIKNQIEEEMFLGLRKMAGISKKHFFQKFSLDFSDIYGEVVAKLKKKDLIIENEDQVKLTKQGLFLGNEVFSEFLL